MGYKRVRSLNCIVRHGANLEARCRCGREAVFDGRRLYNRFMRMGWPRGIELVARHLRCTACGRRGPDIRPTLAEPSPGGMLVRETRPAVDQGRPRWAHQSTD